MDLKPGTWCGKNKISWEADKLNCIVFADYKPTKSTIPDEILKRVKNVTNVSVFS